MTIGNKEIESITGYYRIIENPCTTVPCLPGLAYAVIANNVRYYLTVNDHLQTMPRSWGDYTPSINDLVTVKGYKREKKDISGNTFHTIETIELSRK